MDDTTQSPGNGAGQTGDRGRGPAGGAFHRGMDAFTALRDAFGETVSEAREKGDLTTDRARELLARAVGRARDVTADARDRFDGPSRAEFEALRRRLEVVERALGIVPDEAPSTGADDAGAG